MCVCTCAVVWYMYVYCMQTLSKFSVCFLWWTAEITNCFTHAQLSLSTASILHVVMYTYSMYALLWLYSVTDCSTSRQTFMFAFATGAHIGSFLLLGAPDFPSGGRNPPLHSHGMGPPGGPMGSGGHMPRPYPPSDDIDPQATRSLFVGNIPKNISVFQLRDIFQRYGDVLVSCVRMWCLCVCAYMSVF